jgi:hypothetical protein
MVPLMGGVACRLRASEIGDPSPASSTTEASLLSQYPYASNFRIEGALLSVSARR